MYQTLTFYHNITRWLVLASLLYAIYRAVRGYAGKAQFSRTDNAIRHWTATIAHIQLALGMVLYFKSPIVKYVQGNFSEAVKSMELLFFGVIHASLMLIAVVLVTIGSAKAKRQQADRDKFKTMAVWFSIALAVIFVAIPWPFAPFAHRPLFR